MGDRNDDDLAGGKSVRDRVWKPAEDLAPHASPHGPALRRPNNHLDRPADVGGEGFAESFASLLVPEGPVPEIGARGGQETIGPTRDGHDEPGVRPRSP
jgi:hypothetical protein